MKKNICAVLLSAALFASSTSVFAATTQEKLDQAKKAQSQSEQQYRSAQDVISSLESKKGQSEAYLTELNNQLKSLQNQIADLQKQFAESQNKLDSINADLMETRVQEEKQRHDMALRIQILYEKSDHSGLLDAFLNADDFNDFVNRASNFQDLNEYDRKKLKAYADTLDTIREQEKQVKKDQAEISALSRKSVSKKQELQELCDKTAAQVKSFAASIKDQQSSQAKLLESIERQKANVSALTAQADAEAEAAALDRAQQERYAGMEAQNSKAVVVSQSGSGTSSAGSSGEKSSTNKSSTSKSSTNKSSTSKNSTNKSSTKKNTNKSSGTSAKKTESRSDSSAEVKVQWNGQRLTRRAGTIYGPSGKETYYNMEMGGVVRIMRAMGNNDKYWVRSDGVKMLGNYVMVAAHLGVHPRGSLVPCSLGMAIVCDTGGFAAQNPNQLDIAVDW